MNEEPPPTRNQVLREADEKDCQAGEYPGTATGFTVVGDRESSITYVRRVDVFSARLQDCAGADGACSEEVCWSNDDRILHDITGSVELDRADDADFNRSVDSLVDLPKIALTTIHEASALVLTPDALNSRASRIPALRTSSAMSKGSLTVPTIGSKVWERFTTTIAPSGIILRCPKGGAAMNQPHVDSERVGCSD